MEIIKPSVEEIVEPDALKKIEHCCRVAYQSFDRTQEGSAAKLLKMILTKVPAHTSTLEHYRIKVRVVKESLGRLFCERNRFLDFKQVCPSDVSSETQYWVYGNLRAFWDLIRMNGKAQPFDQFVCELGSYLRTRYPIFFDFLDLPRGLSPIPEELQIFFDVQEAKDYMTFSVDTDRGVTHEIVRNRTISPTQESTRYCNYMSSGLKILFPEPFDWANDDGVKQIDIFCAEQINAPIGADIRTPIEVQKREQMIVKNIKCHAIWMTAMQSAEIFYNQMLEAGATPQEARSVLPNSVKSNIVLTGTFKQWYDFLALRNHPAAHPQMQVIAKLIQPLVNLKYNTLTCCAAGSGA